MLQEKLFELITRFIDDHGKSDVGKENANFIRSLPVLERLLQDQISKEYLFKVLFKDIPIIEQLHDQGFIYAHQSGKLGPYCVGLSSYDIASKGLCSNASNERASSPPKRIDTLLAQAANLICLLAQEVSGATSLNDLSTVLAGYLYHMEVNLNEKVTDSFIQNAWQSFLYNVNLPFRSGNSPFSNITMDFSQSTPTLRDKIVSYNGQYLDYTYGEIPADYFDRVNMGFIRAMTKGDHLGNPFTFPLVTVNITDEFDYDNPCWLYFLEKADNFGGFYLQNYCTKPFDEKARELNPLHTPYDLGMLYSNCLTADTKILDVNGKEHNIADIEDILKNDSFYCLSFNEELERYEADQVVSVWKSKDVYEITSVIFDNGYSIKCTADHRFLINGKGWTKASSLVEGDSLKSSYLYEDGNGYLKLSGGYDSYIHRMVSRDINGCDFSKKQHTHHKDTNKKNNSPDNLLNLSNSEHVQEHHRSDENFKRAISEANSKSMKDRWANDRENMINNGVVSTWANPEKRKKMTKERKERWNNPEHRAKMDAAIYKNDEVLKKIGLGAKKKFEDPNYVARASELAKTQWKDPVYVEYMGNLSKERWKDKEFRKNFSEKMSAKGKSVYITRVKNAVFRLLVELNLELNEDNWNRIIFRKGYPTWKYLTNNFDLKKLRDEVLNCKVVSVINEKMESSIPVFDLETKNNHNFLVKTGDRHYSVLHNCCRMTFDINDLIGVTGSNPFASGSGVGGINVMAINLNRLMWLSQGKEDLLYPMIDLLIEACSDALEIKRRWLRENWTELFPYLSYYVKDDKTLFSIISVLGMHEGLKSVGFMEGIYNEEGRALAHRVAIHTHDKVHEMSKKYGNAFTLEFAPSESAACKLAEKDLKFAEKFIEDYKVELSDKNYAHNLKMMIRECYRQNINLLYKEIEEQPSETTQGAVV